MSCLLENIWVHQLHAIRLRIVPRNPQWLRGEAVG